MLGNVLSRYPITALFAVVFFAALASAQEPSPAIQFFMPDGSMARREIRFSIEVEGRVETFFSDSQGRFLLRRAQGISREAEYRLTAVGDGTIFATTNFTFKDYGAPFIAIYLKPFTERAVPPPKLVDVAEYDARVPEEAKQAYDAAMRAFKEGRRDEVVAGLERALTIYPDYYRALNGLGLLYMRMNRLDDATRLFERAAKIAPRAHTPRLNLGIILTRRAKYAEAVALLEALHKENQSISEVRIALADALIALNRLNEAEPHLRKALLDSKLDRQAIGNAHYWLGLLLNKKHSYAEAVVELNEAAELLPNNGRIRLQLGGALLQLERWDDAERELSAAYRMGGTQLGGAQLMLGQIYFQQKKYESALKAFEQYLADVPAPPNAVEIRGVIANIKTGLNR
ncbi:MAG: tetratricopeptide repeat protein [Acidobacteriota bacterium]